jgi:DNA-binding transcriptional LysR family regulator
MASLKNVTLRQLRVFEAVARHLSFSRAAEELHLTQPAVSMQVKSLEELVGLPLTELIGKKVFLTQAGTEMARYARLVDQQLQAAAESIEALRGVRAGRLSIGVVSTAKYFAPRLLALFRERHPEVELRLTVHNRETIVEQLADNRIDLAIMGRAPQEFPTVEEAFAEHPLVIVAAANHPLAARSRIDPQELAGETFMIRESGSGTRVAMERFFGERGIQLDHTLEIASNETIKQAVIAGMGVAFISAHTVGLEQAAGLLRVLPVDGLPARRKWNLVHLADKQLAPAAQAFREFLLTEGAALVEQAIRSSAIAVSAVQGQ